MVISMNEEQPLLGRHAISNMTECYDYEPVRAPLLNRIFGGGAQYRTSQMIRQRSMRYHMAHSSDEESGSISTTSRALPIAMPGLKKVLEELEATTGTSQRKILLGLFAIFNHFAGGVISMMVLEGWSLPDAAYFSVVTLTTVGYGDLSPTTTMSKLFVIYYSVVSIAIVSSYLAYFVGQFIDRQEELILSRIINTDTDDDSNRAALLDDDCTLLTPEDYHGLIFSLILLAFVLAGGTAIFSHMEGFTMLDSFYATVISATTVGFGDLHPRHPWTKLLMTFWLVFSTVSLAKVVADFTECRLKVKQRKITRRILTAQYETADLKALDANSDGEVEWGEFLEAMLVGCGKVTKDELVTFRKKFQQLDRDVDGKINVQTCR